MDSVQRMVLRRVLRYAEKLDSGSPPKKMLLMAAPAKTWDVRSKTVKCIGQATPAFLSLVHKFNQGEFYAPRGQSIAKFVKQIVRKRQVSTDIGFEALREFSSISRTCAKALRPPSSRSSSSCSSSS
eukprot:Sspe_Gene.88316::Locus_60352_Transcript_1_2_Confidence_0.500_Length_443::g.88316::m.88316